MQVRHFLHKRWPGVFENKNEPTLASKLIPTPLPNQLDGCCSGSNYNKSPGAPPERRFGERGRQCSDAPRALQVPFLPAQILQRTLNPGRARLLFGIPDVNWFCTSKEERLHTYQALWNYTALQGNRRRTYITVSTEYSIHQTTPILTERICPRTRHPPHHTCPPTNDASNLDPTRRLL